MISASVEFLFVRVANNGRAVIGPALMFQQRRSTKRSATQTASALVHPRKPIKSVSVFMFLLLSVFVVLLLWHVLNRTHLHTLVHVKFAAVCSVLSS
jgi:hypothetical protein